MPEVGSRTRSRLPNRLNALAAGCEWLVERGRRTRRLPIAFSTLLGEGCSRIEVIVTFLAVLELIKLAN